MSVKVCKKWPAQKPAKMYTVYIYIYVYMYIIYIPWKSKSTLFFECFFGGLRLPVTAMEECKKTSQGVSTVKLFQFLTFFVSLVGGGFMTLGDFF